MGSLFYSSDCLAGRVEIRVWLAADVRTWAGIGFKRLSSYMISWNLRWIGRVGRVRNQVRGRVGVESSWVGPWCCFCSLYAFAAWPILWTRCLRWFGRVAIKLGCCFVVVIELDLDSGSSGRHILQLLASPLILLIPTITIEFGTFGF